MGDLAITASAAAVGISSAVMMTSAATMGMHAPGWMAASGLVLGSAAGALAVTGARDHAARSSSDRVGTSLTSPNVAIPAAIGAALVGASVYGTQRIFGSPVTIGVLSLGAAIIGGAATTAAYNYMKAS